MWTPTTRLHGAGDPEGLSDRACTHLLMNEPQHLFDLSHGQLSPGRHPILLVVEDWDAAVADPRRCAVADAGYRVAGFISEWWLTSNRNAGRLRVGTGGRLAEVDLRVAGRVRQLASRYNQFGPEALGDRRRGNGATARLLTPALMDGLRERLTTPPPDGGVWTTTKVAVWMAHELGLVSVYPQRAWDALRAIGWSIQAPRPKNPAAAGPEEQAAFKKNSPRPSPRKRRTIPAARSRSSAWTSTASG